MEEEDKLEEEMPDSFVQTEYDDGSIEFDFSEDTMSNLEKAVMNISKEHFANLAENIDEHELLEISNCVVESFEEDKQSRSEWDKNIANGLKLLGITLEDVSEPFPGACAATHPIILESAVKFQAKASNELFSPKGPVKTAIKGMSSPEKEEQALRIKNHMNYQIMEEMEEFFDETERMLFYLPIVGSAFKKTYYSRILDRPISEFIHVDNFIVNYYSTNLNTATRYTHVIQKTLAELKKDMLSGMYMDVDLKDYNVSEKGDIQIAIDETTGIFPNYDDEVVTLLEHYCYYDFKEIDEKASPDGIPLPYIITLEKDSGKILAIRRNWEENDKRQKALCPFTHYKFVPGMGFYGLGYIHLLGNLQVSLTTTMRSLVDSGSFANLQGGFVDKRLRIRDGGPLAPGEYRETESGGLPLKDAILPLMYKEPSQTLFAMFQHMETRSQKFADSTEQVIADSTNYGPVGTTIALLEASTKFFSGVHKRLHRSQKNEFKILAAINFEYLDENESFDYIGKTFNISKDDYDGRVDIVPESDPNMGSQAQKLATSEAIWTRALQARDIHDMKAIAKYSYMAMGIEEGWIEKFVPEKEEPIEADPVTDLQLIQQGKPVKAFPGQDHDSHIAIKMAFLQDPMGGGHPSMASLVPLIQANIQDHVTMKFKESVYGLSGAAQGVAPNEQVLAQAAQKVSQQNQEIMQLRQEAPDAARNKLADAEVQRVYNESKKLEAEIMDSVYKRSYDAMKLELEKYKIELDFLKTQQAEANKAEQTELKELNALLKESMKIKAAAETAQLQADTQKETAKRKAKPSKDKV